MRKSNFKILSFILCFALLISCNRAKENNDVENKLVKQEVVIAKTPNENRSAIHDVFTVFSSPPKATPSNVSVDGPLLGNGDMGVTMNWDANKIRFFISKNDFWKSKPEYPNGGPRPIGGLDLFVEGNSIKNLIIKQTFHNSTLVTTFPEKQKESKISTWVDANKNILFIKGNSLNTELSFDLWAKENDNAIIDSGLDGEIKWVIRKFKSEELQWASRAALAIKKIESTNAQDVIVAVAVCTNMEQKDYLEHAISMVKDLTVKKINKGYDQHLKWWDNFWNQSQVVLNDSLLEKYYYASQYIIASCSRNEKFPPGLYGNWITTDSPAWASDYHLNYNFEAPFWGSYSSNHIGLTTCYDTPLLEYIEKGKKHSKELLGAKGIYFPVGIGPKGFTTSIYPQTEGLNKLYGNVKNIELEGGSMFCGQKSNALFASMNMFMRYYSTYDKTYARKILPYLFEVANFWDNYLVFENGRYVIYNDSFWEVGPWSGEKWHEEYGDFNPILSLGMLHTFYRGIMDICKELNTGRHRIFKWQHILDHLSGFPTIKEKGEIRFKACEGGDGSGRNSIGAGRVMGHGLVFPSGAISQNHTPELFLLMQEEIGRWSESEKSNGGDNNTWLPMGNGFESQYTVAARMKYNPDKILKFLKKRIELTHRSNLWIDAKGGGIETCAGIVSCINEMLLRSYDNIIEVFPNWPKEKDASFNKLRAYGAFLVSSEKLDNEVKFIEILSEKGKDLTLINPWPNKQIILRRTGGSEEILRGDKLKIKTSVGDKIIIKPISKFTKII